MYTRHTIDAALPRAVCVVKRVVARVGRLLRRAKDLLAVSAPTPPPTVSEPNDTGDLYDWRQELTY
jgi:hypothetical protein